MKLPRLSLAYLLLFCLLSIAQAQSTASAIYEKAAPSVVLITSVDANGQLSYGSGVILRADGVIGTNFHVIDGAVSARVQLANGDIYDDVSVLDTDERRDIAILKVKAINLPTLIMADSNNVKVGATVYVIGAPRGLTGSLSSGLVSSLRSASEVSPNLTGFRVVQFTASISEGSSGGPLLDESGKLLGLVFASRVDGQNLNLAIPANYVTALVTNAKNDGRNLKRMSDSQIPAKTTETRSSGLAEIAGTYTGPWSSDRYGVSGTVALTISVVNGQVEAWAVFTGSEYFNQDALIVSLTPIGSGVWKMDYKGKKSKMTGTGIFRGGRFVGDYRFKKFFWVDRGRWDLQK